MKERDAGIWKSLAGVLFAAVLCAAAVFPAFAANTVSSVRLRFEDKYEVGVIVEPDITCTTSGLSIESISWSRDLEKWTPGKKVTATIILSSDDGREFASTYGNKTCKISGATLGSAKAENGKLKVTASYYPVVELDVTEQAGWSTSNRRKATWKKVEYATGYQIRLYRDDVYVRGIEVTGTSKDLSEYMKKEANYSYEIRAVGKDKTDAKYRKAGEYAISTNQLMDDMGDTEGRWRNEMEGKKYRGEDGAYISNQWYKIADQWYYFDENGYMTTGWQKIEGLWYYMNEDGVMQTEWQKIDGVWYFMNADGSMATGWLEKAPGQWYYLFEDGSMAANTVIDGRTLDASGLCVN